MFIPPYVDVVSPYKDWYSVGGNDPEVFHAMRIREPPLSFSTNSSAGVAPVMNTSSVVPSTERTVLIDPVTSIPVELVFSLVEPP